MKSIGAALPLGTCMLVALGCPSEAPHARVAGDGASTAAGAAVERGRYLVSHVAACADCHSPRRADGEYEQEKWLSGIDCFIDVVPEDAERGCISTRNLTQHETGLLNRTDREIQDMFLKGVRPDGRALHPFMPYRYFGNMRQADADAIVAYLRTVPGVEHTVSASQPPFLPPKQPAARVPEDAIPQPSVGYADTAAALRGRYLAGQIGSCLDCHTPRGEQGLMLDRAFQGGLKFERSALRLSASYPEVIYSRNLTPHATGIAGWSLTDVVRAVRHGEDRRGERLCPPMPVGAEGFGGLSDSDASDIAHYLLSLPPAEHPIPEDCRVPGSGAVVRAVQ